MRSRRWAVAAVGVITTASAVQAQIFKEQFDTYTGTYLAASSGGVWVEDGCRDGKLSDTADWSPNYGLADYKDGSTNLRSAVRNRHHLTTAELLNAGLVEDAAPNCVDGTDENPLVLKFYLYLGRWTSTLAHPYYRMNNYVELACGDDRAPTPMLDSTCSNGVTYRHLNLLGDSTPHRAIAIGQVAMADTDPCDDASAQFQRSFRLSVYDGLQWHFFTTNELHTCAGFNFVEVTLKTNSIEVMISNKYNSTTGQCERSMAAPVARTKVIARQYPGKFTAVAMGGLRNETAGGCWDQSNDPGYPTEESGFDDLELSGGVASNIVGVCENSGACCKPDHSCEQLSPSACAAIPDAVFNGLGTECWIGAGRCCAAPVVDGDFDTDVDMSDFAKLQRCIGAAGPEAANCTCFDTNEDGVVNITDVEQFAQCASGAGVVADIDCDDSF